ncbi:ATP-binding protein [Candidatus Woesearchaeota archaeon]|nr:ATP-binding protein [Candidatus Woesearchaeota archaeon]
MDTKAIEEYLIDVQKREFPSVIKRDLKLAASKKIQSIIGPRRAGKTYYLFQIMQELIQQGVPKSQIIHLNFEDPRLIGVNFTEIKSIVNLHWQLYPDGANAKQMFIFIDEPQNILKWETAVRALHDEGFYIYLTGSSSKLLSKEIATSLRGRTLAYTLLPFSFKEFLSSQNNKIDAGRMSSKEKSLLLHDLNKYLSFGGFPEVCLEKNEDTKIKILNEYFQSIVYKDLVERYGIKNIQLVKWLIKSLGSSFSKEFSVNKVFLTLKTQGVQVSKNTLYNYLSMLEDSVFVFFLEKFSYSYRKKEFSINKVYLNDTGYAKLIESSDNKGSKMENAVYLELERRKKALTTLSYWKNQQQEEVDFVVKNSSKIEQLVQVCHDLTDISVKKRELSALIKASKELRANQLLIITYDYEGKEKLKGKTIYYIPLWKWLLTNK